MYKYNTVFITIFLILLNFPYISILPLCQCSPLSPLPLSPLSLSLSLSLSVGLFLAGFLFVPVYIY